MKRLPVVLMTAMLVSACGGEDEPTGQGQSSGNESTFTATLNDKTYDLAVRCSYFDQDYFQFLSDKTDAKDSNGDGLVISGMQMGQKLILTIIDNDVTFSTANLENFTKSENTASGSGKLFQQGTSNSSSVEFSVTCA